MRRNPFPTFENSHEFPSIARRRNRIKDGKVNRLVKWILAAALLSGLSATGWWLWKFEGAGLIKFSVFHEQQAVPDSERYDVLIAELQRWRKVLGDEYRQAESKEEKAAIENDARLILELTMPEMMRCWLGTPYDFNGTAEKPGVGKIACGYFVSTVIRDAGFRVNRYKLAQQPSENILRTFIARNDCILEVGTQFPAYADKIESMENGIYLVGLDTHVGFIVKRSDGMKFIHASGSRPWAVVEENRRNAGALQRSNWRMTGCLTGDSGVIRTWLAGEKVIVRK